MGDGAPHSVGRADDLAVLFRDEQAGLVEVPIEQDHIAQTRGGDGVLGCGGRPRGSQIVQIAGTKAPDERTC